MESVINLKSISDLNNFIQVKTQHPLVAVVDFSTADEYIPHGTRISADFYTIMFKNYCANKMRYGRESYDFQEGSLICIAPKQVLTMDAEIEKRNDMMGWGLFFHPDLLNGFPLSQRIRDYTFFSYEVSEALHLSDKEKQILYDCVLKINQELDDNIDNHSQNLIVSNIELLLNYCLRYYGRQFITRKTANSQIVIEVENVINGFFQSEQLTQNGIPTVKDLASRVNLSASYLSDLLKKETGMNAQEHIHYYLIKEAKKQLLNTNESISEIAYSLGFDYPQYFSKLFKNKTGKSPIEYRNLN